MTVFVNKGPISAPMGLPGGVSSVLNITPADVPVVVKASAGVLARISVITPGSASNLTVNDSASGGGDTTANEIFNAPFGNLTAGQVIPLEWPCAAGITVSSVPTGGQVAISFT